MKCLDTSIIIDLFRGNDDIVSLLEDEEKTLAISYPIICELYKGVYKAENSEEGEDRMESLLQHLLILEASPSAAKEFGKLKQKYPDTAEFDLLIASICIIEDAELMTQDTDFQTIEELSVDIV